MKNKLFSILLSLAMIITMLPMATIVSSANPNITVYNGDVPATEGTDYEWNDTTLKIYSSGLTLSGEKTVDEYVELNTDVTSLCIKDFDCDGALAQFADIPETPISNFTLNVIGNNTVGENGYEIISGLTQDHVEKITILGDGNITWSTVLNTTPSVDLEITGEVSFSFMSKLSANSNSLILSGKAKLSTVADENDSAPLELQTTNFIVKDEAELTVIREDTVNATSAIEAYSSNITLNSKGKCEIINESEENAIVFNSSTLTLGENIGLVYMTGNDTYTYAAYSCEDFPGGSQSFYMADNIQMFGSTQQNCSGSEVTTPATYITNASYRRYPSLDGRPAKTVVFKQKNYNVTVDLFSNIPGKGTTTCYKNTATKGEELTITASAATGYSLDSLKVSTVSGRRISLQSGYKFKMPAEDVIIEALYTLNQSGGSGSGSGSSGSNNELVQLLLNKDIINAKATANDSGKVKVSWNKIGMATGYEVYGDGNLLGTATTNSYVAPICAKYTVRAIVKFGGSNIYSNFSDPAKLALTKNSITSLKSKAKKQLTVKFKKVAGAQTYEIKYKATNGSWKVATTKSLTKTIKKLSSNKKYTVKIRGIYAAGSVGAASPWSASKTVKVK